MLFHSQDPNSPDAYPFPQEFEIEHLRRALGSVPPHEMKSDYTLGSAICVDTLFQGEAVRITIGVSNLHRLGIKAPDARYVEAHFIDVSRIVSREGVPMLERIYFDYENVSPSTTSEWGRIVREIFPHIEPMIGASLPRATPMKMVQREPSHELLFGGLKDVTNERVLPWRSIVSALGISSFEVAAPSGEKVLVAVSPSGSAPGVMMAYLLRELIEPLERPVLGALTGATGIPFYQEMVSMYQHGWTKIDSAVVFNLDEYFGVSPQNRASFAAYMHHHLYRHVNIPVENRHLPTAENSKRYSSMIQEAGGFDIVIGGIGLNGHFAYNEPGSPFSSRTRCITLAESSRRGAAAEFGGRLELVPEQAYTIGLLDALESAAIIQGAAGAKKIPILKEALFGPITEACPSSILRTHPNFLLVVDGEIAEALRPA